MREVIWEFFVQHACFSYGIENNETVANENVSIASVRPEPFKNFLASFVPYFGMLKTFREFQNSILGEYFTPSIPDTYRSYNCALQEILQPIFEKITQIEDTIRKQECVYTLLALARDLKPLFQKVEVLHQIHEDLMVEFSEVDDSFTKVTYLLSRLYYALLNSASKVEQNIYLTLYLQSLYKYFTIIEIWLTQDLLEDYSDEFVIVEYVFRPSRWGFTNVSVSASRRARCSTPRKRSPNFRSARSRSSRSPTGCSRSSPPRCCNWGRTSTCCGSSGSCISSSTSRARITVRPVR